MWPCKILWRDPWRNSFCTNLDNDYHYLILGFLVCVYSFLIVDCEKSGPYPLWMHTFYCAADFMGIWVFLSAYLRYDHFWFFLLGTFGAVLLVACGDLWKRRDLGQGHYFAKGYYFDACLQVLIFFVSVNLLRVELHDESIFKFWIFTQVIICVVPGLFWEKRGTRIGASWQLNIVFVLVAVLSFNLWNMWALISPQYYSMSRNPWFYIVGWITLLFALRGCYIYANYHQNQAACLTVKSPFSKRISKPLSWWDKLVLAAFFAFLGRI